MSNEKSAGFRPKQRPTGPAGPMHGGMGMGEKAKDFKGSMTKLIVYMKRYHRKIQNSNFYCNAPCGMLHCVFCNRSQNYGNGYDYTV